VKAVDKAVADNEKAKLASFVVFLTDKTSELEPKVADLAKKESISKVPLTIVESVAGPEKYKVAKDAEVTVILYAKGETKANFAFKKGELTDAKVKEVAAAVSKITSG
jgi:hypothetical protein